MVRTGVLRVFGANLRNLLARSMSNRFTAMLSGIGVTALVQSSTATSLMTASFVGQGLIPLTAALAVMRGADVGTALMAVLFSTDLSWLSPLLIFLGVVLFISKQDSTPGRVGRVFIGLGLMLLALRLIVEATEPLLASDAVRTLLVSVKSDFLMELLLGAILAIIAYSSLAIVLLIAAMAASGAITGDMALGLVLGANLGSGVLAVLQTTKSSIEVRQVTIGNLIFKIMGIAIVAPFTGLWMTYAMPYINDAGRSAVLFHLAFNILNTLGFIWFTGIVGDWMRKLLPKEDASQGPQRPRHLDPSALTTPSLAISCAAREALHQADVVESMLIGLHNVVQTDNQQLSQDLRKLDDTVDELYSAIKYYMTKISRAELDERESQRWTEVINFTINMEQIGDIIERVLTDVENKKIKKRRQFSKQGMEEINELHTHLLDNLRLAMSVFLSGNVRDAQKLLEEKARFRDLELAYSASHLERLSHNTVPSIETSSLHIDLISDLKRINSLLCSVAYPILEAAGALANTRLKDDPAPTRH